jgi:hypothetical protein
MTSGKPSDNGKRRGPGLPHPGPDNLGSDTGAAWAARAGDLADWAMTTLANRVDVWGGYYRAQDREGCWHTQQTTHPRIADRGRVLLTTDVLTRHFAATHTRHVIGLHTTSPDNTSRWGGLDFDAHGPGGHDPAANLRAAIAWFDRLRGLDFAPLLTDSNGSGGYHLLALFAEPVPTPRVWAFLRWLTKDHTAHGLAVRPECFPKQPRIDPGGFGNWLRLVGLHHSRPHRSRVWSGDRWLEGEAAALHILALAPAPASLVPALVKDPPEVKVRVRFVPAWSPRPGRLAARIRGFIRNCCPNLGEGQGRDDVGYRLSAFLVHDLALSDAEALKWLTLWDRGNSPSKGEARLLKIMSNARRYGRRNVGRGRWS